MMYAATVIYPESSGLNARLYDLRSRISGYGDITSTGMPAHGVSVDRTPIDVESRGAHYGARAYTYRDDYYDRIHYSVLTIDVGRLSTAQTRTIEVWSAYREPRMLMAIDGLGTEGISLLAPAPPPTQWAPLESRTYEVQITLDGPPVIEAAYTWRWDVIDVVMRILGERITAWSWSPDWRRPVMERLVWRTDVITAYDGTEQRRRLREHPRHAWECEVAAWGDARRRMESAIWAWQGRVWAWPIWPEGQVLDTELEAGDLSIPCDPQSARLRTDTLAMLRLDADRYELVEIDTVDDAQISLRRPLEMSWPPGTRLYPVRLARMRDAQAMMRHTDDLARLTVRMDGLDPEPIEADAPALYRGLPVLELRPDWRGELSDEYQRTLAVLDYGMGGWVVEDTSARARRAQEAEWLIAGRAEIIAVRRWLAACAGRWRPVWVPSWCDDLVLADQADASAQVIRVRRVDYARLVAADIGRRDIRIQLRDGTVIYRRITGAVALDDDTEQLALDSAIGVTIAPEHVLRISYMAPMRLDSDQIEIAHITDGIARLRLRLRSVHDDV